MLGFLPESNLSVFPAAGGLPAPASPLLPVPAGPGPCGHPALRREREGAEPPAPRAGGCGKDFPSSRRLSAGHRRDLRLSWRGTGAAPLPLTPLTPGAPSPRAQRPGARPWAAPSPRDRPLAAGCSLDGGPRPQRLRARASRPARPRPRPRVRGAVGGGAGLRRLLGHGRAAGGRVRAAAR